MNSAADWIDRLGLERHPEGGYFRETYRSTVQVGPEALGGRYDGPRPGATSIYFLVTAAEFSALHRLRSDELWHYHAGSPLTIHLLDPDGQYQALRLGLDLDADARPQRLVPAGYWFGSTVDEPDGFTLVGCTVTPGFDFRDFELARRADLIRQFPQHRALIERLTRGD